MNLERALSLAVMLCVGCAREVTIFDGAPTDGAKAVILVAVHPESVEAHAIDLLQDDAGAVLAKAETVELIAMSLERELSYYRLEAGPLPVASDGARAWPHSVALHRSALADGVQTDWTKIDSLPPRISELSLDLAALGACDVAPVGFSVVTEPLPTKQSARWAARFDDRTALVMTGALPPSEFYLVNRDEIRRVTPAQNPAGAMYQTPDGTVWIAGRRGVCRAALGSLDFERVADGIPTGGPISMTGPTDPSAPFEMYGLNILGHVDRFDGTSWTKLGGEIPTDRGDTHWLAPSKVVVAREAVPHLEWIDGNAVTNEVVFEGFDQGVVELDSFPPYELIAGTRDGYVLARQNGVWTDFGPALLDFAFEIEPDGESFIVTGSGGEVARWVQDLGFCIERLLPSHAHQLLPLEDGYLVIMSNLDSWSDDVVENRRFQTPISWFIRQ